MEKFKDFNKEIAKCIILAQIASDSGKGISRLHINGDEKAFQKGYKEKEYNIKKAIELINSSCKCSFKYYCKRSSDYNRRSNSFYFAFEEKGKQYVISFHSFSKDDFVRKAKKNFNSIIHWNNNNSFEACKKLILEYNL